MAYHERSFATAFAFDRATLESLGMHRATIAFSGWPRPVEVEGPLLRDVLAAAGAAPGTVNIVALDGFATAYAFDRAMLEALGMHRATIAFSGWPRPVEVEGPLLRDVLAAAGAAPETVNIVALDGFATDLTPGDLASEDWIVAIKEGDHYLGIGQRGPAWVLYAPRDGQPATAEDEQRWPWAAFLIEVR